MTLWEQISINFAVLINLLVAFFYPFADGPGGRCHFVNVLQVVIGRSMLLLLFGVGGGGRGKDGAVVRALNLTCHI